MKKSQNYKLSDQARELLEQLAELDGLNRTAALESMIRETARRRLNWRNAFPGDTTNIKNKKDHRK